MDQRKKPIPGARHSGLVEILSRKSKSFWKKKDSESEWKQCTLKISEIEVLQYYRNKKNHGEVPLNEIKDVVAFRGSTNRNLMYPFCVHFDGEGSPWIINTHTEQERREWMEAILIGSTRNQWTDTQLRHTDSRRQHYHQMDYHHLQYETQESSPYIEMHELNLPPPSSPPPCADPNQPIDHPAQPEARILEDDPQSHYLTILPTIDNGDDQEEADSNLPDVPPAVAFATEFMKNFDPVQVDLMVQILLSAVTCSASRPSPGRTLSEKHRRRLSTFASQQKNNADSKSTLTVPSENEDAVSRMSNEMFDGAYHRLADLYIHMKDSDLSSIDAETTPDHDAEKKLQSQDQGTRIREENPLYAPIGNLLIDLEPSSNQCDNTDASLVTQHTQESSKRARGNNFSRQNAVRYKLPLKNKRSPAPLDNPSRSRSSSESAVPDLPTPPLPPKTCKENPDIAISKLRTILKRASSSELLDDDSSKHPWSKASADVESEQPWPYAEHSAVSLTPIPWSAFSNVKEIGEGQFGTTYSAEITDTGLQVALKSIKMFSSRAEKDECLREIGILNQMQRPSVAKLYGYSEFEGRLTIVQELVPQGDLKHFLMNNKCSVGQLLKYMLDIAMGMHYISAKGLIHKKLAARNILIDEKDQCKVADLSLGMKYDFYPSTAENSSGPPSLLRWMAPECLSRREFSAASDVWSFGVLQWEMFTVPTLPYHSLSDKEYIAELKSGVTLTLSTPRDCPPPVVKIMNACWNVKPSQRPSFLYISSCLTNFILEMNVPRTLVC